MFSSNSLLQLVFGYHDDSYYTSDLMKLNLEKYLDIELRRSFSAVYFVKVNNNKSPVICSYGIKEKSEGSKKNFLFGFIRESLTDWICRKLTDKEAVNAIVIDAFDFCRLFGDIAECGALKEIGSDSGSHIRRGSIIIKMSPIAEKSGRQLLTENAFELTGDESVIGLRAGGQRPMYPELMENKPGSCFFLNAFTEETITNVVKRIMWDFPERFINKKHMSMTVLFLKSYLNNRMLQWKIPLFEDKSVLREHYYKKLYEQLALKNVWKKLCDEVLQIHRLGGSISEYLSLRQVPFSINKTGRIFVTRQPEKILEIYLRITPTACSSALEDHTYTDIVKMLDGIHQRLLSPMNAAENEKILTRLGQFRGMLSAAARNDDGDSYYRVLKIIDFLTKNIYLSEDSERGRKLEKNYDLFSANIKLSADLHKVALLVNEDCEESVRKNRTELFEHRKASLKESDERLKMIFASLDPDAEYIVLDGNSVPQIIDVADISNVDLDDYDLQDIGESPNNYF